MADGGSGVAAGAGFASLRPMVAPRSVAVIGASDEPTRIGGRPVHSMIQRGFSGALWPVNPKRDRVQGLVAYPDIAALPGAPDAAIIAVPGALAEQAVDELGRRGCPAAIVFTAGYAEVDEAGRAAQEQLVSTARAHGMRLLGPNCLGLFNAPLGYFPIFTSSFDVGWPVDPIPGRGRVGIASQSGAYGTHLFGAARNRGISTPVLVTTGNEAEVTLGDVIGWMAEDDGVDIIAAYSEGVREGPHFLAALEAARRAGKPVVMMKVGRSALGAHAAQSHTASIAGDDAVTGVVLEEFGVHRARNTEEMLDVVYAATPRIYPVRNTLGVVSISGGAGVMISDAAEEQGIPMPPMPEAAQARLKALIPFSNPSNPVDCTAQVFNDMALVGAFARSMVEDGGYSSLIAFFTTVGASPALAPRLRAELNAVRADHPDRLWCLSVLAPPERVREYEADGYLVFEDPSRAVVALAAQGRFGAAFARVPRGTVPLPAVTLPQATPNEAEAKRILADAGVPAVPEATATSMEEAVEAARAIGFPVVMKLLSPDILHKSEIGGVMLNVADEEAVRANYERLMWNAAENAPKARVTGVLVARQVSGAVEVALGILRDPVFGPVAMVGLGGVFIEVLRDVALRRCPVDVAEAEAMIRSLRGFPLLDGARGRPRADVPALAWALSALSAFAVAAGERLVSVDVNPVLVLPEGQGAWAADAVIELAQGG
ncbi:acetate--CoA ligase family protein [Roseomonas sp. SSH11]|uniref:Acetate--CoA ligase family protein n=1 Tax=Pararoseomonas baculiformis TaxID=2820812 RepID=A0ABS4AH92_9PROT|nr:acetate--CoA ligase family protein [Pararoseomonas baculiformis]MBP0446399.1 acetate--CoA ligase family protein [Pararoseomonas baculiformis]